jgi:hypothetical protein
MSLDNPLKLWNKVITCHLGPIGNNKLTSRHSLPGALQSINQVTIDEGRNTTRINQNEQLVFPTSTLQSERFPAELRAERIANHHHSFFIRIRRLTALFPFIGLDLQHFQ